MMVIKSAKARGILKIVIPFIAIPLLIILGATAFDGQKYLIVALGVACLSLLLFMMGFEKRRVGARRLVIVAVMTALSVVGRIIPFFKPVTALTIITGAYLGGEAGFCVGALSAIISNFYFGQGPWTAFQMLAWGMAGLIAGSLAGPIKKHRWVLLVYGVVSGALYSMVMDVWTVVWYNSAFDLKLYCAAIVTALPFTLLYAASNFAFLFILGRPMGSKLERIKTKYGI